MKNTRLRRKVRLKYEFVSLLDIYDRIFHFNCQMILLPHARAHFMRKKELEGAPAWQTLSVVLFDVILLTQLR